MLFNLFGDFQKLPTAKTNSRIVLPMCQDEFGHVDWNYLLLHCICAHLCLFFHVFENQLNNVSFYRITSNL